MRELPLRHAFVLGLLHGPTELLPISSSGHTTLVPWLAGWPYGELSPELHKSFEVALHAGTATALLLRPPWGNDAGGTGASDATASKARTGSGRRAGATLSFLAAALMPPALAGYTLGGQVERRLGTPTTIAAGLLAGSIAMSAAEMHSRKTCPERAGAGGAYTPDTPQTHPAGTRRAASAGARDGLALGLAQALALIPGMSRSGATIAAARARGFSRMDADLLSWKVGLPVIAGATALKGTRLALAWRGTRGTGIPNEAALPLAVGAAGAFLSTLASSKVLNRRRRTQLLPACVVYRGALAAVVIRRMRDNTP
ncbi:MAG TPA: undecaprenyl-diphosphate phosphatase [Solirubrobacteraceae bacterium]